MPSTLSDRLQGLTTSVAVKAPCRLATTTPITVSGLQTIDGVALAPFDRVLVKDQANQVDNGIYISFIGGWARSQDFDGTLDAVHGTLVFVQDGTISKNIAYRVAGTSSAPVLIGTDAITFEVAFANVVDAAASAGASATAAAGSAATASDAAASAGASATAAAGSAATASDAAASAGASATAAAGSAATAGAYPNAAASNVPRGLTQASVGAITAGSGGTNGTFALGWSGGNFSVNPTGTFTVAGGVLTAITITGPGLYIGASPTPPTATFAASTGLTGAAVVLTAQFLVASGVGYWVESSDGLSLLRYLNNSGIATADVGVGSVPNTIWTLRLLTLLGEDISSLTNETVGSTTPNTSTLGNSYWLNPAATTYDGYVSAVSCRTDAAMIADVIVIGNINGVQQVTKIIAGISFPNAGTNDNISIGNRYIQSGSRIAIARQSGGWPRYVNAGAASSYMFNGPVLVGDTITLTAAARQVAFSYTALESNLPTVIERLVALESASATNIAFNDGLYTNLDVTTSVTSASYGQLVTVNNSNPSFTFGAYYPVRKFSILRSIQLNIQSNGGSGKLVIYRPSPYNSSFTPVAIFPFEVALGSATYTVGAGTKLQPGDLLMYEAVTSGGQGINFPTTNVRTSYRFATGAVVGTPATGTLAAYEGAFIYTVDEGGVEATRISTTAHAEKTRGPHLLHEQRFVSSGSIAAEGWISSGAVTPTVSNGLTFNGIGGWSNYALWNAYSSISRRTIEARVKVNATGFIGGLMTQPQSSSAQGNVLEVDDTANTLKLYTVDNAGSAGTPVSGASATIPAMVAGRTYLLQIIRDNLTLSGKWIDTLTGTTTSIPATAFSGLAWGGMHGRPGFVHRVGNVTWQPGFKLYANHPKNIRAVIFGDSNAEGTVNTSINPTWCQSLQADRLAAIGYYDVMVAARSGSGMADAVTNMLCDIQSFSPEIVIVALGTNDSQGDVRQHMPTIVWAAQSVGAKVYICSLPPKSAGQAAIDAINADFYAYYYGRDVDVIDFAGAVSTGNDRSTWNATYMFDGIHLNNAGQLKVKAQGLIDAPEVYAN